MNFENNKGMHSALEGLQVHDARKNNDIAATKLTIAP
jgi:hypothetical protein